MTGYTRQSIINLNSKSTSVKRRINDTLNKAGRLKPQKLDALMLKLHDEEFAKINCLECALCCKSISPAIYRSDIKRMAAFLKLSVPQVIDTYLTEDNDGEFVFRQTPCPFLGDDNYCSIYESRPKACREYPHTNRKRFYQILSLTAKNAKVCPAVFNIVEKLRGHI